MSHWFRSSWSAMTVLVAFATGGAVATHGAETAVTPLDRLAEENRQLQGQVRKQQDTIEELSHRLNQLLRATEQQQRDLKGLQERVDGVATTSPPPVADRAHEVRVAGEAGIALFHTGKGGPFPNSEFRVDDPVLSVEAPVWQDIYVFGELKLLTRETSNDAFQLGEFYVDCENVSQLWGRPGQLSLRAGRINTPFGEEYQVRTPAANPLISHSLGDLWGTDEGIEIYGSLGPVRYVLAAQNGGISRLRDYNADKALVGRLTWDPVSWLRLSGSAMRTGELAPADNLSDLWFANGFFRSVGSTATTAFWADLFEGDAIGRWKTGHLAVTAGTVRYDDNDRAADNARRIRYGYVELVQGIADRLYGAARYSGIRASHGYPMVGSGTAGEYFFRPSLTEQLRRFSLGLGYRFADPVVLKFEYSWNTGHLLGGKAREDENFFGSEIGLKF